MKSSRSFFAALAIAAGLAASAAQAEEPVWTRSEVKKIDIEQSKVTLKHEEIVNLDMPAMTMVFRVADPAILTQLQPGQKIGAYLVDENGTLVVKQVRAE